MIWNLLQERCSARLAKCPYAQLTAESFPLKLQFSLINVWLWLMVFTQDEYCYFNLVTNSAGMKQFFIFLKLSKPAYEFKFIWPSITASNATLYCSISNLVHKIIKITSSLTQYFLLNSCYKYQTFQKVLYVINMHKYLVATGIRINTSQSNVVVACGSWANSHIPLVSLHFHPLLWS